MDGKHSDKPTPKWPLALLGIFFLGFVGQIITGDKPNSRSTNYSPSDKPRSQLSGRVSDTMSDTEKEIYDSDPSSAGFSKQDRDFLNQHGVSEEEARAIETILRENGIE